MPTAVEYALTIPHHTQNGCGSGPPAQHVQHTQNGSAGGPPAQTLSLTDHSASLPSAIPSGELLITSPLAILLVIAALLATVRRRGRRAG